MNRAQKKQAILDDIEKNWFELNVFCSQTVDAMVNQSTPEAKKCWKQIQSKMGDYSGVALNFYPNADDAYALIKLFKELGGFVAAAGCEVIVKQYRGVQHFLVKTRPGYRKAIQSKSYYATPTRSLDLTFTKAGAYNAIRQGARLGVYCSSIFRISEFVLSDEKSLTRLFGGLGMDFIKIYLAMQGTAAIAAAAAGTTFCTAVAVGPFVVVVGAGFIIALTLYELDNRFNFTEKAIDLLDDAVDSFKPSVNALSYTIPREFKKLKDSIFNE
ncbi:MAG TPA: hypothetical protein DHW71_06895 [Gammaproteobacteria bacterium]|nr:hypothetical protein [Gammaproteobacteria bacterium]HBF08001.1 hypothetical protein [Gammaproteobacteria bacterium]HCK92693.1 hypothetical protein [Gammaproteobacteria bacterium]|tara:strand:+ start:1249 stop:2061 length:813 start_codon:yes stop_codon:yes gene_type:complete